MLPWLDRFFSSRPIWQTGLYCALLVVLSGVLDDVTGDELSFAFFYLAPITIAAWYLTRGQTSGIILLAATVWFTVEFATTEPYRHQWILFWNSGVRLGIFAVVAFLVRQLRAHVESQQRLARTDNLTGLLNRAGFMERSEALVKSAARYRLSIAIGYIDLDGFKKINDTRGHVAGDELLSRIGATLRGLCRDSDVAARMGGDEFAVLLPNTDHDGASVLFEKLHAELLHGMRQGGWPEVGVSIGAIVYGDDPPALAAALNEADRAMYRAKQSAATSVHIEAARSLPPPLRVAQD